MINLVALQQLEPAFHNKDDINLHSIASINTNHIPLLSCQNFIKISVLLEKGFLIAKLYVKKARESLIKLFVLLTR